MDLVPKEYKRKISFAGGTVNKSGFLSGTVDPNKAKYPTIKPVVYILFIILIIVSLVACGALMFLKYKTGKDIEANKKSYEEVVDRQNKEALQKIIDQSQSEELLFDLLKSRRSVSKLLSVLAQTTLPKVQWSSFSLGSGVNEITLSGTAASYKTLAQQIVAFKNDKNWLNADFSSIVLDKEGVVGFSAKISFDPALFINK